jgi:hypothetical protein
MSSVSFGVLEVDVEDDAFFFLPLTTSFSNPMYLLDRRPPAPFRGVSGIGLPSKSLPPSLPF